MELGSQITAVICILIELLFLNRNFSDTPTKYCPNSIFHKQQTTCNHSKLCLGE